MRSYYLKPTHDKPGCRGGVKTKDGVEYELEVGSDKYCSAEMLALCAHIDEILEFLQMSQSTIAKLILHSYYDIVSDIQTKLDTNHE
jgi:hypothetical protein